MKETVARKSAVTNHLEKICAGLELTETQYKTAEKRYDAVGEWLAASDSPILRFAQIYPQGSISLGTTVKPIKGSEYDVDLVCHIPNLTYDTPPKFVKKLIGDRLRANGLYDGIIEEKPRCWRLNYANEFHMDITPSIRNLACTQGGELVPDKTVDDWKPSNPKGYKDLFDYRAELQPKILLMKAENRAYSAGVEPFPDHEPQFKGVLRRCVQVLKAHRDQHFQGELSEFAPISVILTTLASQSYAYCVQTYVYQNEFDVLLDVMKNMHLFIETSHGPNGISYFIPNETTDGENFAEKWNYEAKLPKAFFNWRDKAITDIENLPTLLGIDNLRKSMNSCFGESAVAKSFEMEVAEISTARKSGLLSVVPGIGLSVQSVAGLGTKIPSNTFFGS